MKRILFTIVIALLATSCETQPETESKVPISNNLDTELEELGRYKTKGGYLYVYKFNNDTIYWAEGRSQSCPVSIQVK